MTEHILWEGERTTLTSMASKGKLVRERYRLTADYLQFDAGILSTKEEQIPTWAMRDVDVSQSIKQKAMGVGDITIRCEHNDYTGRSAVTLEGVKDPKAVKALVLDVAKAARDMHLRRSQTTYMNVEGGTATGVPSPSSPAIQPQAADDPLERLGRLKQLLDAGALSQDEFDAQKAKLLGL